MKAVILAGGEGTRLWPLTVNTPKAMVPIANIPYLELFVNYLGKYGITDVILALGYLPGPVLRHFGDGSRGAGHGGVRMVYSVEPSPMGTAGAVKFAEKYLDDTFFVFNGDMVTDIDLASMLTRHRESRAAVSIALTPVEDPSAYGLVETDSRQRVRRFVEKPPPGAVPGAATTSLINAGIYVIEPHVLDQIPPDRVFSFERELFPGLLERGDAVCACSSSAYWIDIGTLEKYLAVNGDLLSGRVGWEAGRPLGGMGEGTVVSPGARIEGPVLMGENCRVGRGAWLRGPVVMGRDCYIGEGVVVDGAVLWNSVQVGERTVLRRCVVASDVVIEAACVIPERSVIGDKVTVGRGNRLEPGVKISPGDELAAKVV